MSSHNSLATRGPTQSPFSMCTCGLPGQPVDTAPPLSQCPPITFALDPPVSSTQRTQHGTKTSILSLPFFWLFPSLLPTWHSTAECCKHSQDTSWIPKDRNLESVTHHLNVAFLHFQLDLQPSPLSSSIHSRCGSCAQPLTLGHILHLVPPSQELSWRHPPAPWSLRGLSRTFSPAS